MEAALRQRLPLRSRKDRGDSMTPTPAAKAKLLPFWWADNEEGPYSGPFDSRDLAIDSAYCYRAECFDDPSQKDGFFLLNGEKYPNPEYSSDYPNDDFENSPHHITGKPEYILALDITDEFHKAWNTRALTSGAAGEEMPYAKWLKEAADPNCKLCDGSGVFYGNVHICQCVTRGHLTPAPRQPEQARQMGPSGPIPFPKEYFDLTIENLGHAKEAINLVLDDLWKGRNPFSNAKKTLARISDAETCLNKTDIAPTPDLRAAVEALEFYANDMNYLGIITSNRMEWPINCDNGKRAREALTTLKARMPEGENNGN